MSPLAAAFSLPLGGVAAGAGAEAGAGWWDLTSFVFLGFYAVVDLALASSMIGLFNRRWRVM